MNHRKIPNLALALVVIASLFVSTGGAISAAAPAPDVAVSAFEREATRQGEITAAAAPTVPTDETQVPHYFGPNPNWALSPFTVPNVSVTIGGTGGSGATATASVGANGALTGITVTDPGSGYTTATVTITGAGSGATAVAVVTSSAVVNAINLSAGGSGYKAPVVTISLGGGTGATATASGGVENTIAVSVGGSGYTNPTVEFDMPDDPNGTIARGHIALITLGDPYNGMDANGTILPNGVVVDDPGSGYYTAPNVKVYNGTFYDPIACQLAAATAARVEMMQSNDQGSIAPESSAAVETDSAGITAATPAAMASAADCGAVATTTLTLQSITLDTFGAGYTSAPTVAIADSNGGVGTGAAATATIAGGGVTAINLTAAGSGYITPGGIKKFVDPLPGLCNPAVSGNCPATGKYIPLGVPEAKMYAGVQADEYEIGLVQYRTSFSSSLKNPLTGVPVGTLVRGYVQLETPANAAISQHFPLTNELLDGTKVPVLKSDGVTQWLAVTPPQWLGPTIAATKDKPVRIIFRNLLPVGSGGDLILPTDSTLMGSGMARRPCGTQMI